MNAESFRELMDDEANHKLVLELVDRFVNRDIKWQIVEAYNEAIANQPMQELRGELVSMKDGIAQVKILDPMPSVTGSFRVVVDGGLAGWRRGCCLFW